MSETLRVLIVDDEPIARELLCSMLAEAEDVEVVAECRNALEAIEAIRKLAPDVVFLDVEMPGGDGFSVIDSIGVQNMPATVFVTAYDHHAIKAFEVVATDYLLKPFDERRLESTLERLRGRVRQTAEGTESRILHLLEELRGRRRYPDRIAVEEGDHMVFVPARTIDWIEAKGKHSLVHAGTTTYLIREGLTSVTSRLDPADFIRVHRSAVVRIDRIKEVHRWFRGDYHLVLTDGTKLTSGATFREALQQVLLGR
jgi:two-component system, LytTR family, response regulator